MLEVTSGVERRIRHYQREEGRLARAPDAQHDVEVVLLLLPALPAILAIRPGADANTQSGAHSLPASPSLHLHAVIGVGCGIVAPAPLPLEAGAAPSIGGEGERLSLIHI